MYEPHENAYDHEERMPVLQHLLSAGEPDAVELADCYLIDTNISYHAR